MKESVNIAYTFAKQFVASKDKDSKFFNSHQLHLHVPEGAVSKDGPSAGVAMTTSLIRLFLYYRLQLNNWHANRVLLFTTTV
jgi:Lon-like ATP-dependent protease